ncbi:hypothetical protein OROGR_011141 [Orobanche gracilis]
MALLEDFNKLFPHNGSYIRERFLHPLIKFNLVRAK